MLRVVLDANVLVSGLSSYWKSNSVAVRIVRHLEITKSVVIVSDHLISEVGRALSAPYFRDRMTSQERMWAFDATLRPPCAYVEPIEVVGVASHSEDDIIIGTALAGNAAYLVTSDRQLLKLVSHQGIAIVSPPQFLAVLEGSD